MRSSIVRHTLRLAAIFAAMGAMHARRLFAQPSPVAEPRALPGASPRPEQGASEPANGAGPIERLPLSAYPEPRTRGLRGGSLWMTFHGLQWPYYRQTGIGISGYAWIDTGYEKIDRGHPTQQGITYWLQQARFLLRVTPTYTQGNYFVQGQAELVANKEQSTPPSVADADDVWVRAGRWNTWDLQLGRYEAWEIYHFGMGLDLNTLERRGAFDELRGAPEIYGVTYAFYRPPGVGQAAMHLYPTDFLRFELGTQIGNEFGSNALAGRPVGILDLGWLKLKGGVEYKRLTDQKDGARAERTMRGGGAAVQFVFDPYVELGVNGAYGLIDTTKPDGTIDAEASTTTTSWGGFANGRLIEDLVLGVGVNLTKVEDLHYDPSLDDVQHFHQLQAFGAIQYTILRQLFVKAVFAYAKADSYPTFGEPIYSNKMASGRLRLLLLF